MLSIRPTVAEHAFHVLGRSIHPELYQVYQTRRIQRTNYRARIDVTSDGHVICFASRSMVLSEIVCSTQQPLPQSRRKLTVKFAGKKSESIEEKRGFSYHTEFELERVSSDMFWMLHNQLQSCRFENHLVHSFDSSGRIAFGAVSFIHIEEREKQLRIQAFHTFPDDCGILKSTSTFHAVNS